MLTPEVVRDTFDVTDFVYGDPKAFYTHVADDVSTTITGTDNPISGYYSSKKEWLTNSIERIASYMATPMTRTVTNVLVSGDWTMVEYTAKAMTKSGREYSQEFCWLCRFEGDMIVEIRIYMDSALVKNLFEVEEKKGSKS